MKGTKGVSEGFGQVTINVISKVKGNAESDNNRKDGPEQPLAKLLEMLEERHLLASQFFILRIIARVLWGWVLDRCGHTWGLSRAGPQGSGPSS